MEIREITEDDIDALIEYGNKIFPDRANYYSSIVNLFQKNRIGGYTGGVIIVDDKGEIKGQTLFTRMKVIYNEESIDSGWGYDLIIDEDLRDETWGVDLLMMAAVKFRNTCATGSNPNALKINYKLGSKLAGEIRKYIGVSSFPALLNAGFKKRKSVPLKIRSFHLISDPKDLKSKEYWNKDIIEINRDLEFLKWRFFSEEIKGYKVYQNLISQDYFVVRIIKLKGIKFVSLVDFRCDLSSETDFSEILRSVKKLAQELGIIFIICGSTHFRVDQLLEKNLFRSIGRPRPFIVGKGISKIINEKKVEDRSMCLVTLADSDGEVSWQ